MIHHLHKAQAPHYMSYMYIAETAEKELKQQQWLEPFRTVIILCNSLIFSRILAGNAKQLYQKLRDFNVYQHIHPDWVKENRKVLNKDELNCLLRNNPRMQLSNKEKKLLGYL